MASNATAALGVSTDAPAQKHSVLNSTFPVLLPYDDALFMPEDEFQRYLQRALSKSPDLTDLKNDLPSPTSPLKRYASSALPDGPPSKSPFIDGLHKCKSHIPTDDDLAAQNKTLTDNGDVSAISSKDPLVNLFYDLSESLQGGEKLLEDAWSRDSLMTLKIIFNARSIHLGKSNRVIAYKALGWLAEHHPLTFLSNLRWLVRPIIRKKAPKPEKKNKDAKATGDEDGPDLELTKNEDEDFEILVKDDADPAKAHDVQYGVSHGYWKDLLNLVVLAAHDQLHYGGNPKLLLNVHPDNSTHGKKNRVWDSKEAKTQRKQKEAAHHARVFQKLDQAGDAFYTAIHLTVARLFAQQLREDLGNLKSEDLEQRKKLSLAGKWAPTFSEFHDKHTFIQSSIAEILFPHTPHDCHDLDREGYLRKARELYRKTYASPLRKALSVVERDIAANRYDEIKYECVPSLAMDRYSPLFAKKDFERFFGYVQKVGEGKARMSGATLLPSTLVMRAKAALELVESINSTKSNNVKGKKAPRLTNPNGVKALKGASAASVETSLGVLQGQWSTLVQRIRDSGTISSSLAVCDVSGSMCEPVFSDGSRPVTAAIGLSLLVSEVTAEPFGGTIISFSESPTVLKVGGSNDSRDFVEKVSYMDNSPWGYNTNFVKIFEDLILPMAIQHKLAPEEMCKQVFVFSDMQFDQADAPSARWTSSFERIKQKYAAAGYEMPKMIFWNLAADSSSKPVTMDDVNTALVSGYSQGMLKAFMDGAGFEDTEKEEIVEEVVGSDGETTEIKVRKKMDPLTMVKRAVSHEAYSMLEVVD